MRDHHQEGNDILRPRGWIILAALLLAATALPGFGGGKPERLAPGSPEPAPKSQIEPEQQKPLKVQEVPQSGDNRELEPDRSRNKAPGSQSDYYTLEGIPFPVRYLVDDESAAYRTGNCDPAVLEVPAAILPLLAQNPAAAIVQLARFFRDGGGAAGPAVDKFHLAKRIHDWITRSVAYDTQAAFGFTQDSQDPMEFLSGPEGPRAMCRGFSDLFLAIASEAGLEAKRISGVCRTYWSNLDRYGTHAWNAVRIRGSWYIIDTSGDVRVRYYPDGPGETGPYRDENLFISPEALLLTYRANLEEEQLIKEPISFEEFLEMPLIGEGFLRAGANFRSTPDLRQRKIIPVEGTGRTNFYDGYDSSGGAWEMDFSIPPGWEIYGYLHNDQEASFDFRTLTEFSVSGDGSSLTTLRVSIPSPGLYRLNIRARRITELNSFTIYTCLINEKEGGGGLLPEPGVFFPTMRSQKYDIIHGAVREADGRFLFDIEYAPDVDFFIRCESLDGTKMNGLLESSLTGVGSRRYYFSPPGKGSWIIRSYARTIGSEESFDRTGLLLLEANQGRAPGYPFYTPRIEPLFFEEGLEIIRDLEPVPGSDRIYSVILKVPEEMETRNYLLECDSTQEFLRNEAGELIFATGHYSRNRDGSRVEFFFSPGEARSREHTYRARIYLRLDGSNRVVLEYLLPAGEGPGDRVP